VLTRTVQALVAAAVAALNIGSTTAGAASSCAPRHAPVKLRNSELVVYREPRGLSVCSNRTGAHIAIDDPAGDLQAFPSIAANGRFVAWAVNVGSDTEVDTLVQVIDARKITGPDSADAVVHNNFADFASDAELSVKVGRIVLDAKGNAAWTTCPTSDPSSTRASLKPNCLRPGSLDRIWKFVGARVKPIRVAASRTLDPQSLRLDDNSLSWVDRGRTHRARLR
jgi:hypothetical protein